MAITQARPNGRNAIPREQSHKAKPEKAPPSSAPYGAGFRVGRRAGGRRAPRADEGKAGDVGGRCLTGAARSGAQGVRPPPACTRQTREQARRAGAPPHPEARVQKRERLPRSDTPTLQSRYGYRNRHQSRVYAVAATRQPRVLKQQPLTPGAAASRSPSSLPRYSAYKNAARAPRCPTDPATAWKSHPSRTP